MPGASENIGGVSVSITGDISQLQAIQGPATATAQKIGQSVAAGFNTAALSAGQLTAEIDRLIAAIQQEGVVSDLAMQRNMAMSRSLQGSGSAMQTFGGHANAAGFNLRYLVFGLKDLAEGRTTFALAEGTNELIRLKGAALLAGGAVAGIAVAALGIYELGKLQGLWGGITESEKKADEELKRIDDQILEINRHIAATSIEIDTLKFGKVLGDTEKAANLQAAITTEKARQLSLQQMLDTQPVSGMDVAKAGARALLGADPANSAAVIERKKNQEELKKLGTQIYEDEQQLRKVMLQVELQSLTDSLDMQNRETQAKNATVAAAVQAHKKQVEALAKSDEDALEIDARTHKANTAELIAYWESRLSAESGFAERDEAINRKLTQLHTENQAAIERVAAHGAEVMKQQTEKAEQFARKMGDIADEAEENYKKVITDPAEKQKEIDIRVSEIQTKGQGDAAILQIQRQKIDLERQYGLQISHSGAEQVAQARQLAALDSRERAEKLAIAEAQLKEAEAASGSARDQTRIATLTAEIATLKQQNANADAQAAAKIDEQNQKLVQQLTLEDQINKAKNAASGTYQTQQQAIGKNLGDEIGSLPQQVGNDLGSSISNALLGHHPGKSIGQEMGKALEDSLRNTAKKLIGDALSAGFQTVFGKVKSAISGPATGATAAPTGAGGVASGATIPAGSPGAGTPIYGNPSAQSNQQILKLDQTLQQIGQKIQSAGQTENGDLNHIASIDQQIAAAIASEKGILAAQLGALHMIEVFTGLTAICTCVGDLLGGFGGGGGGGGGGEAVSSSVDYGGEAGGANAGGTDFWRGGMSLVGEKGPEIVNVPRGAQIIPNHAIHKYASGTPGYQSSTAYRSTAFQAGTTNLHFHAHGMTDPSRFTDHVMRTIPEALKRTSPGYSPYSH